MLLFSGLIASMRRPLEELVEAAGRLAGGDLSTRVKVGGLSETATLGAAFNEMAGELELEAGQRDQLDRIKDEFVLTASHELRSPLTSVQGFAELLMLERDKLTPSRPRRSRSSSTTPATWSACSTTCSTSPAATPAGWRSSCSRPTWHR